LLAIADRSAAPQEAEALAYGTDEDNLFGVDPQALTFDLGRDPVAFADRRIAIVQDLFQRLDRKDPRQVFRRLDPVRYYPIYGDAFHSRLSRRR
jgi:hypothetical protein